MSCATSSNAIVIATAWCPVGGVSACLTLWSNLSVWPSPGSADSRQVREWVPRRRGHFGRWPSANVARGRSQPPRRRRTQPPTQPAVRRRSKTVQPHRTRAQVGLYMPAVAIDLAVPDLATLHERRSEKWAGHAPDVLAATIAEMDFPLAPPVGEALREAID